MEAELAKEFKTHVVPLDKAYPTSGKDFIRVSANSMTVVHDGDSLSCELQIKVTVSTRIRTYSRENEHIAYRRIIKFAENVYFYLFQFANIKGAIMEKFPLSSVDGLILSSHIALQPQPVYADFYDSMEVHQRQPAGFKIEQDILLPRIWLRAACAVIPTSWPEDEEEET